MIPDETIDLTAKTFRRRIRVYEATADAVFSSGVWTVLVRRIDYDGTLSGPAFSLGALANAAATIPILTGQRVIAVLSWDGVRIAFPEPSVLAATIVAKLKFDYNGTWQDCIQQFDAYNFWYPFAVEEPNDGSISGDLHLGERWFLYKQHCLPRRNLPGLCVYTTAAGDVDQVINPVTGADVNFEATDGVLFEPGGAVLLNATMGGIDPHTGEDVILTIVNGVDTSGYNGFFEFIDSTTGDSIEVRVDGDDGKFKG